MYIVADLREVTGFIPGRAQNTCGQLIQRQSITFLSEKHKKSLTLYNLFYLKCSLLWQKWRVEKFRKRHM